MKNFLRMIKHRIIMAKWSLFGKKTAFGFYGEAMRSISARWHGEFEAVDTYHSLFSVMKQRRFGGAFLELGGGYSTILANMIFDRDAVDITSVDFHPAKYDRILNSKSNRINFLKSIDSINAITVSFDQVEKSLIEIVERLLTFDSKLLDLYISSFITDSKLLKEFKVYIASKNTSAICEMVTKHPNFQNEVGFYIEHDALDGGGICSQFSKSERPIDALFLDCGEASSIAEFLVLEEKLQEGCFVLLHDIFYPKSVKNFLLATLLSLDPGWEVLFIETISAQGGLVAIKV